MSNEQKELNGVLFVNNRKEKETHPDYKGSATIGGKQFWVSGWRKSSRDGNKKFLSLAFKAKEERAPVRNQQRDDPPPFDDDKDLPF